jgi:hypothetical protein
MPTNLLAARSDQENLVQAHHQAAAAKPLNQGASKGYNATKTPAAGRALPKTPFKVPLNDENGPVKFGKSVLKTNGKGVAQLTAKKGDKTNFITPAGRFWEASYDTETQSLTCTATRNRPALGAKTTNAKANVFLTPAPQPADPNPLKTVSPRLRRAKVKVHQAEAVLQEDDELDIEYAPPKKDRTL